MVVYIEKKTVITSLEIKIRKLVLKNFSKVNIIFIKFMQGLINSFLVYTYF